MRVLRCEGRQRRPGQLHCGLGLTSAHEVPELAHLHAAMMQTLYMHAFVVFRCGEFK